VEHDPDVVALVEEDLDEVVPAPERKRLAVASRDPSITLGAGNGSADDPRLAGAMLRVSTSMVVRSTTLTCCLRRTGG
jgi:hypothetical protein